MVGTSRKNKLESILLIVILICSGLLIFLPSMPDNNLGSAMSSWTQTSDTDFDNGTYDNTLTTGTGVSTVLRVDFSEQDSWTDKTMSLQKAPSKRYWVTLAPIWGTDKVLLFSGDCLGGSNDIWIYDLSDDTWTENTPVSTSNPIQRDSYGLAPILGTDQVLLFGGICSSMWLNDTWAYDLSDNAWTEKTPQFPTPANNPSPICSHAMAPITGTKNVLMFGGDVFDGVNYYLENETWVYNSTTSVWNQINIQGSNPSARYHLGLAAVDNDDKVILFGGSEGGFPPIFSNETWVYDASLATWTKKDPNPTPAAKYAAAMATISGTADVLLFGGLEGSSESNDTWVYQLNNGAEGTWTKILPKDPLSLPTARFGHGLAMVDNTDKAVLFGGYDQNQLNNDTWVYNHNLQTKNGTYTSMAYDIGWNSTFNSISWRADTPVGTSIKFQLKTACNESYLYTCPFIGPDGTTATFYTEKAGEPIWSKHNGDCWVQYIVYLNITGSTSSPSLKDVTISYNCLPQTTVVGPINGSLLMNNKPTFEWTFEDYDSSEQRAFQVLIDDDINFEDVLYDSGEQVTNLQTWEFPVGTDYSRLPDGKWYWKVRTQDTDGAWTEYSAPWEFCIDTIAPISAPTNPINNGFYSSLNMITGMAYDMSDGSGIKTVEINIKHLNTNSYWDGSTWSPLTTWLHVIGDANWTFDSSSVSWNSGSKYNIQSRATDNASNIEIPTGGNVFTIDTDSPVSTIEHPGNEIWLNNLEIISGNSIDIGGSGVSSVDICIKCTTDNTYWDGGAWITDECWLTANGAAHWTYDAGDISFSTGYEYNILSAATDNVSIIESPSIGKFFKYDAQPPWSSIFINNDDEYTNSTTVTLSLEPYDSHSGVAQMSFSTDDVDWSTWEPFSQKRSFTLPANDGEKVVYFKVKDEVENIGEPVNDTIILDSTAPEDVSIAIKGDAKYTNTKDVLLDLQAHDSSSGLNGMAFSIDGIDWTNWEPFSHKRSFSLPSKDGEKIVYLRVRDKVGNIAEASDTIKLDTEPPHSLSITINGGLSETNSTLVSLKLSAVDECSGVYQSSFSIDGKDWSSWEPFTNERSFILSPQSGGKTIYFKVKDNVGNIAIPIKASITLDTNTPGEENENERSQPAKTSSTNKELWLISIIIVIVIVVLSLIALVVLKNKKKHALQERVLLETLTIKPGGLSTPVINVGKADQVTAVSTPTQLPRTTATDLTPTVPVIDSQPQPALAVPAPAAVSALARSTQVSQAQDSPQLVPQLPQLPPAENNVTTPVGRNNGTVTTPVTNESAPPVPQAQASTTTSGPTVHLPDSPQSTTTSTATISQQKPTEKKD